MLNINTNIIGANRLSGESITPINPASLNPDVWLDASDYAVGAIPDGTVLALKGSSGVTGTVSGTGCEVFINSAGRKAFRATGTWRITCSNQNYFLKYHNLSTSVCISFVGKISNTSSNPDEIHGLCGTAAGSALTHGFSVFFDNRSATTIKGTKWTIARAVAAPNFTVNAEGNQFNAQQVNYNARTAVHFTMNLSIPKDVVRTFIDGDLAGVNDRVRTSANTTTGLGNPNAASNTNPTNAFQIGACGNNALPFIGEIEQLIIVSATAYSVSTVRGIDKYHGFNHTFGKTHGKFLEPLQTITDQYLLSGSVFKNGDRSKTFYMASRGPDHEVGTDKQGIQSISTNDGITYPTPLTVVVNDATTSPHNLLGIILPSGEGLMVYAKLLNAGGFLGFFYRKSLDQTTWGAGVSIPLPVDATGNLTIMVPHDIINQLPDGTQNFCWYGVDTVNNNKYQIWNCNVSNNGTTYEHYKVFDSTTEYVNECSQCAKGNNRILVARIEGSANISSPNSYRHRFFKSNDNGVTWSVLGNDSLTGPRRYVYPHPPELRLVNDNIVEFSFVDRGERRWYFIYCLFDDLFDNGPSVFNNKTVFHYDTRQFGVSTAGGYRSGYPTIIHPDGGFAAEGFFGAETVNDNIYTANFFKIDGEHGPKVLAELGL